MNSSASGSSGQIFISYRRDDTEYVASWIRERLERYFGKERVFEDVYSIEPGSDFVREITSAVTSCVVLIAVIGDQWLTISDSDGRRRLDDPKDWVRIEIETALERNIHVVPVLVGRARMPQESQLPESLAGLARRQALELMPRTFDTSRLRPVIEQALAASSAAGETPGAAEPAKNSVPLRDLGYASQAGTAAGEPGPGRSCEMPIGENQVRRASSSAGDRSGDERRSGPAAILAGRAAQREFVDNLARAWLEVSESWTSIVASASDLGHTAESTYPDGSTQLGPLAGLADWLERAASASPVIEEMTGSVRAIQQRVHRNGVIIGVAGRPGSGKSTLVRKLSGLGGEHRPV